MLSVSRVWGSSQKASSLTLAQVWLKPVPSGSIHAFPPMSDPPSTFVPLVAETFQVAFEPPSRTFCVLVNALSYATKSRAVER